ncbi:MAG TPA: PEGA domain-containing protein [Vicinamibacterales bacterium]|nr:PEGA domain-containing protein [Vicinamibacterales bacterium]
MVFASDSTPEVPGFADPLGDRVIVPQPSGSLLEFLYFRHDLASAPFFEPAVKDRLTRLTNFRHSSYTRVRRLQRGEDRGGLALVSTHIPGRRLSEILQIAGRSGTCAPVSAVLALSRQLMTAVALMHDYGPDIFHGAIGPERLILAGDGRVVLCEYVLGTAFEQAVPAWGVKTLWRERRIAMLPDASVARYGRRVDLLQIGLVVLACLLGRPLAASDYPEGLPRLLDAARETTAKGEAAPLGPELRAWLSALLGLDAASTFRTLVDAQKELAAVLQPRGRLEASPQALQAFVEQCEGAWTPDAVSRDPAAEEPRTPSTLTSAAAMLDAAATRAESPARAADAWWTPAGAELEDDPGQTAPETAASGEDAWFKPVEDSLSPHLGCCDEVPALTLGPGPVAASLPDGPEPIEGQPELPQEIRQVLPPDLAQAPPPDFGQVEAPDAALDTMPPAAPQEVGRALWEEEPPAPRSAPEEVPVAPSEEPTATSRPPAPVSRIGSGGTAVRNRRSPRRTPSWAVVAAAVCVLIVIAAGAIVAPMAWSRAMGGPPIGQLVVESDPSGADIVLDGKEAGRTPATLTVAPGPHHLEVRGGGSSRAAWVTVPEGEPLTHKVSMPEAALRAALTIMTNPPGGTVSVDGTDHGKAPVRLQDLTPGTHRILAVGPFGPVEEELRVEGGTSSSVTVATVGWVKIRAPYPLEVSEKGQVYGETSGQALMVPAGRHHFDLVNADVALKVRQFAHVPAGSVVTIPFEPPLGMMNLSSDEPAEVLLDGSLIGRTPMTTLPVPLGPHEVVFRHGTLGDVRYSVNVSLAAPVRLAVTFKKK